MSNRHYRNLAHQAVNIMNEEQEAYVESPSLPANLPPQADNNAERGNSAANSGESDQARVPASDQAIAANAENLDRVDGYDEVFDQNVSADFECPICMLVLRNPVQTGCGHRFCGACINRHLANVHTCPIDNQQLDPSEINADNFAKREIYMLRVKCRTVKNEKECPWIGCLKDVEEHLKTCPFVEAPCPKGCNQNVERKALDHHLKKECPKRTTTCTHCKTEVLHKNYKDHYGKCQKVVVPCPNCKQKMLREKLVAGHEKECPKGQAVCDFKSYGCKWTGQRFNLQNHLNNEIQLHLSMLCAALAVLLPQNGKEKSKGAASGGASASANGNGTVSATVLEEFNRQRNKNTEAIATLEAKLVEMERKYRELRGRTERQQRDNESGVTALKNTVIDLEARMCNGVYLWRIEGYPTHLENARENVVTALHSPPFYTSFYGYKLCLRINPNGVDTGYGTHVSLFVHMMQSPWDDTLEWPFSGRISLSILDQSDDGDYKRHISETLVTRPNLLAFQRPTTPRNHKGYGYVEFAHIETLQDRQYVKNDCLLVRVQVFQ